MPPRKISPWRAKPTLAHHSLAPWRHVVDSLPPVSTDWLLTRSILDGYKLILTSLLVSIWEYPLTSNDFFFAGYLRLAMLATMDDISLITNDFISKMSIPIFYGKLR
jgi:hypothetical protein